MLFLFPSCQHNSKTSIYFESILLKRKTSIFIVKWESTVKKISLVLNISKGRT